MAKSILNPSDWGQAVGKIFSDVKADNPIDQTDLRIVAGLGFLGGAVTQGARANNRIKAAELNGTKVKAFKAFLV